MKSLIFSENYKISCNKCETSQLFKKEYKNYAKSIDKSCTKYKFYVIIIILFYTNVIGKFKR